MTCIRKNTDDIHKRTMKQAYQQMYEQAVFDDMERLLQQIDDMANMRIEKFIGTKEKTPNAIYMKLDKKR